MLITVSYHYNLRLLPFGKLVSAPPVVVTTITCSSWGGMVINKPTSAALYVGLIATSVVKVQVSGFFAYWANVK
jgi:hypothetical protein